MSTLLEQIAHPSRLKAAWGKLNRGNKTSHGLSTETIEEFQNALDSNITELSNQLRKGKFHFQPVRGVVIPKKEKDKYRELRIADVRDRLVLKAIAQMLDIQLSQMYDLDNPCSFAYRKERNVEQAIQAMVQHYKSGLRIILEADIKNFFGSVNRDKLLENIFKQLPDASLNELIIKGMSQEVGNIERLTKHKHLFDASLSGIPQGNALSPLLANICLSNFDKRMMNEGFRMVRYADDFVVMCKSQQDAQRALSIAKDELEAKLQLEIWPLVEASKEDGKTRIVDPKHHKFSFLSIRFNGSELWVNENKVKKLREKIREVTDIEYSTNLLTVITRTKNLLEGWLSAFKFVNVERDVEAIDDYIDYQLFNAMRKLSFALKPAQSRTVMINKTEKEALTRLQRVNTGVPGCMDFLRAVERNKIRL